MSFDNSYKVFFRTETEKTRYDFNLFHSLYYTFLNMLFVSSVFESVMRNLLPILLVVGHRVKNWVKNGLSKISNSDC